MSTEENNQNPIEKDSDIEIGYITEEQAEQLWKWYSELRRKRILEIAYNRQTKNMKKD